jgi:hypothetical protein
MIVERCACRTVFFKSSMPRFPHVAERIGLAFAGHVTEIRYNYLAGQGIIFLEKDGIPVRENIEEVMRDLFQI